MLQTLPFWITLTTTVLLIAASLFTGLTGRRRLHLWLGPLTMVSLTAAIVLTEQLMKSYDMPRAELDFHLYFAKAGGLLALPVIATGVWLWRSGRARVWHRLAIVLWLIGVLCATGTGLYVFSMATLKTG